MTRISSLAANTSLVNQLLRTQSRLFNTEVQIASGKISQDYQGIAIDSRRLINLENTRDSLRQFIKNNDRVDIRLKIASTAIDGIQELINDFSRNLNNFAIGGTKDKIRVQSIQEDALRTLKSIEDLLNTEIGGRFLFAGARVNTEPVNFGLTNLANFQATFDGSRVTVATTRDANLENFSLSKNGTTSATNWLTFVRDQGGTGVSRVTATSAEFTNVTVGSTITISGTGGINDGTFEVIAVTGTTIDIKTEQLTDEVALPVTISYQDPNNTTNTITLNSTVSFTRSTNTIARTAGDALTNVPVGAKITIVGAAAGPPTNNGSFTVASNGGTSLVVESTRFTDQGTVGTEKLSFTSAGAEVTFTDNAPSKDTIVAAAGRFSNLVAGMKVTISGATDAGNNTTFTVSSVSTDGSTITVDENVTARVADANTVAFLTQEVNGTIAATSYYKGDSITQTHRLDKDRSFEFDINAIDPAFEKAIRGMRLIMQGVFQTEGGLDQNAERIGQAKFLIGSSLNRAIAGTPPFGTEKVNSIEQMQIDVSFDQVLINRTKNLHTDFIGFLESSIANIENADPLETITKLLAEQRTLEASFQTLARIRQLSLVNFI